LYECSPPAANEKFDLILLDITYPDKGGFRVLEFLEKNHIDSKVMVINGTVGVANIIRNETPEGGSISQNHTTLTIS